MFFRGSREGGEAEATLCGDAQRTADLDGLSATVRTSTTGTSPSGARRLLVRLLLVRALVDLLRPWYKIVRVSGKQEHTAAWISLHCPMCQIRQNIALPYEPRSFSTHILAKGPLVVIFALGGS